MLATACTKSGLPDHFGTTAKRFREAVYKNRPHAYPVPGPRSQFSWRSSAIGFLPPPGGNLAHAPAFYQPLPAHGSSALAVRASSYVDRVRHFARQYSRPSARRAGRRLLLLLQRIARAQWLRKDVRTSQIRQPLVGHHLRQAAPAKALRRLQRWPAPASPRPRRTRPVAKLSGPAGILRNNRSTAAFITYLSLLPMLC
jgi:hypothetical protein